jgi:hypothetical protein
MMQLPAKVTLWKDVTAIESQTVQEGGHRCGLFVNIPEGTELTVCGNGFSERTVTVECQGCFYFVFTQDIDLPTSYDLT